MGGWTCIVRPSSSSYVCIAFLGGEGKEGKGGQGFLLVDDGMDGLMMSSL